VTGFFEGTRGNIIQIFRAIDAHKFPFNILAKLDGSSAIHDTISQLGAKTGKLEIYTLPIAKILSVKNARAWVSMVSYLKRINEN
jgi:hypothetical protein